ncbi:hypothetical protein QTO34_006392 [Cnephaeus nilssonii]|uniref:Interleukin-1 receptor antagonist protein n=1 Tax=Cnephaeus nilssonii TaxID=3371016 RepID=A0AA40HKE6_CNENI|nr:hypothetical protein QTO34_006392 [Eptesicus nilssonii]
MGVNMQGFPWTPAYCPSWDVDSLVFLSLLATFFISSSSGPEWQSLLYEAPQDGNLQVPPQSPNLSPPLPVPFRDSLPPLRQEALQDASLQHWVSLAVAAGQTVCVCSQRIWDVNQKTFYLRNNQLVAGYLQGPNTKLEEKIDVVPVKPHTVLLGIHGGKLCLACVKAGDEIRLQLERYTFIRSDSGPTTTFESVACPGWFLCTALEADQPVSLTNAPREAIRVTKFYFQQD